RRRGPSSRRVRAAPRQCAGPAAGRGTGRRNHRRRGTISRAPPRARNRRCRLPGSSISRVAWAMRLSSLDAALLDPRPLPLLAALPRPLLELAYFTVKEARARLFAGLFFVAIFLVPREGILGLPRDDALLLIAIAIQAWRLLDVRIRHHPPYWLATLVALAIYVNFFSHHFIGDYRWYIAAC